MCVVRVRGADDTERKGNMAPLAALSALGLAGLEAAVFFGVPVPPSAQMLLAAFFTVYMGCRNGVALGGAEEAVQVRRREGIVRVRGPQSTDSTVVAGP